MSRRVIVANDAHRHRAWESQPLVRSAHRHRRSLALPIALAFLIGLLIGIIL